MSAAPEELIKEVKDIKQSKKITYSDILDAMTENGIPAISLSTLRRVFAPDSEDKAQSFKYQETLLPIVEAIRSLDGTIDENPQVEENKALRVIIDLQREELDHKNALINRLIDRLDQKDEIIKQIIHLTEKCMQ